MRLTPTLLVLAVFCMPVPSGAGEIKSYVFKLTANDCVGTSTSRFLTAFKRKGWLGLATSLHGIIGCKSFGTTNPTGYGGLQPKLFDVANDIVVLDSPEMNRQLPEATGLLPSSGE